MIGYDKFLRILDDFKCSVLKSENERDLFKQAFIADRSRSLINVSRLYGMRANEKIRKMYEKVDMYEEADNPDMVDNSGYLGLFYREKR